MATTVHLRRVNDAILLELRSPDGYPRLERAVLLELRGRLEAAAAAGARGVVLHGSERAFAVGADLAELSALDPVEALRFSALGQELAGIIARSPGRVVAAVRGYCLGGGLDLALACAARIATPDAAFAHRGAALGILTGWGGTARLPHLVGRGRARELFVTGRTLTAEEARQWGLIEKIVPPDRLLEAALEAVGSAHPPASVGPRKSDK